MELCRARDVDAEGSEIVVRPRSGVKLIRLQCDLETMLDVGHPGAIAAAAARRPERDQRLGAELVEVERLRHRERLAAGRDRTVMLIGEHLVAGGLTKHPRLRS